MKNKIEAEWTENEIGKALKLAGIESLPSSLVGNTDVIIWLCDEIKELQSQLMNEYNDAIWECQMALSRFIGRFVDKSSIVALQHFNGEMEKLKKKE